VSQLSHPVAIADRGDETGGALPEWKDETFTTSDAAVLAAIQDSDTGTYALSGFLDSVNSGVPRSITFEMDNSLADPGPTAMTLHLTLGHNHEDEPINFHVHLIYTGKDTLPHDVVILDVVDLGAVVHDVFSDAYTEVFDVTIPKETVETIDFGSAIYLKVDTLLQEDDV